MHFCAFVIIPTVGDVDLLVGQALEPFDKALEVEPYRRYLNSHDILRMAEFYQLDPQNLDALAAKMEKWANEPGGVDRDGLYRL